MDEPKIENTTPFTMKILYQLPPDPEVAPDGGDQAEEPAAPPPFATLQHVTWYQMYPYAMKVLHEATECLIESGSLIPIERSAGYHWRLDKRDAMPHEYKFNDTAPRTLPDGKFLDAVPNEHLKQFVFPQHELCAHSGARLLLFARYGPLDEKGILRAGLERSEQVPEHFSYRWPKENAVPNSTKGLMKPKHGGSIEKKMAIKELDEIETVVAITTNPALRVMIEEVEREDEVLSLSKTSDMPRADQTAIQAEVYPRNRRVYNPEPADVEAMFADLPRDVDGRMSFADIQKTVVSAHDMRVKRSRMLFPDLDPRTKKVIPKVAPVGVNIEDASKVRIQKDEEALLSQYVYQMAEQEETGNPTLRTNVNLTRDCFSSLDRVMDTRKRWDSEAAVRQKDTAWMKPSKVIL